MCVCVLELQGKNSQAKGVASVRKMARGAPCCPRSCWVIFLLKISLTFDEVSMCAGEVQVPMEARQE